MKQMLKYNLFKKSILIVLLTIAISNLNAQTGLNFQGVARTTNNIIIASQDITLKLSILQGSATGSAEYIEIRKVKTNAQGLFTAVIGDAEAISTIGNFADIDWNLSPKFLKIELDPAAGNNFITMGTTQFQYVAYAKFANTVLAENISGIVPVAKGGIGTNSLSTLKSNLSLDKVNNTADSLKPISTLTQKALDLKLNIADSAKVFVTPSQMAKYSFTSDAISIDTTSISNRINIKLSKTDTASLSNRIDLILNKIDTSSLSNRINTKLNITDTTSLLRKTDTLSLSSRINTKFNITDTTILLRKADTLSLSNRINTKLNITDTSYLLSKADTLSLSNRVNTKLNIADTSYLLSKADTLSLSNRVNTKLNISDTSSFFRKSQLGMNNGAASLDAVGKIPSVQIPAISFSSVDVVDDMSEMLALPVSRLVGSIAVRLDSSKNFVLANLPASNRENWIELIYPDAPVQTVNGLFGNVDLRKADITDLKNVDNTSDEEKPLSRATRDSLNMKLYITDTSYLLKKSDTSFLLQKVDTTAILLMYAKKFTKDVVVNFGGGSLGKYANGTTIPAKGKTLDEFLLDLVSKSVAPSFSAPTVSIGASPGASSYEIGYDPGVITLSSTFNKNDGGNATSTMFYKNGSSLGTGVNTNSPGSITSTVGYSVIVNYAAGTATKNDNLGTPFPNTINAGSTSASLNFTTYSKRYWGGISAPFNIATVAEITTLSPSPNSDNSGGSRSITTNIAITGTQYAFYAYPATNADLTSIMYNNFESINTFTKTIVQIKNAQGYTQNYKVYTSNDAFSATLSSITFN
jgi:hypothetical protein